MVSNLGGNEVENEMRFSFLLVRETRNKLTKGVFGESFLEGRFHRSAKYRNSRKGRRGLHEYPQYFNLGTSSRLGFQCNFFPILLSLPSSSSSLNGGSE